MMVRTFALLLLSATVAQAQTWPMTRVRTDNPTLSSLVLRAYQASPTFHALVEQIHTTNGMVLIQFGRCGNGQFRSCVAHIEGTDTARFIRLVVDTRLSAEKAMATIAHELHHATELLADPTVRSASDVARVMQGLAIGTCGQGLSTVCETEGALATEAKVLAELKR